MTVNIFCCEKGFGNSQAAGQTKRCKSLFGEKLFGFSRKGIVQRFSRQGRRLCPILERSENSVLIECFLRLTKQVLGKLYPFCQNRYFKHCIFCAMKKIRAPAAYYFFRQYIKYPSDIRRGISRIASTAVCLTNHNFRRKAACLLRDASPKTPKFLSHMKCVKINAIASQAVRFL